MVRRKLSREPSAKKRFLTVPSSTAKQILAACSAREDEIAEKVEAMIPRAAEIQASALEAHADLPARYAALFEGCSLEEQFSMQARAERVGSATWRALARRGPAERERVFLECAALEEASAGALESLIADGLAV